MVGHAFRPLPDRYPHPNLLLSHSSPCFQIAPLRGPLRVFQALQRLLVAPSLSVENSLNAQAYQSPCTHSWRTRLTEVEYQFVAEKHAVGYCYRLPHVDQQYWLLCSQPWPQVLVRRHPEVAPDSFPSTYPWRE